MLRYHVPTHGSEAKHSFGEARFMKVGVLNKQKAQIMTRGDSRFAVSQPKTEVAGGNGGNFVILRQKQNSQKDTNTLEFTIAGKGGMQKPQQLTNKNRLAVNWWWTGA